MDPYVANAVGVGLAVTLAAIAVFITTGAACMFASTNQGIADARARTEREARWSSLCACDTPRPTDLADSQTGCPTATAAKTRTRKPRKTKR